MELIDVSNCMQADEIYEALQSASGQALAELSALGLRDGMTQEELLAVMDQASEQTFSELVNLNIFGPVLTVDQIMQICSGTDEAGSPNAYAALQIDTVTEDNDVISYASIAFGNPVLNVYAAGGCVVVTADFDRANQFEYRRARDILNEWIARKGDPEFSDKFLTLSVFPVATNGQLSLMYHELVFVQGTPSEEDGVTRLIMAFDGNETQEVMGTNVRLDELKSVVDAEQARLEAEAQTAAERDLRIRKEEDVNVSEEFVKESFAAVSFLAEDLEEPDDDEESILGGEEEGDEEEDAAEDNWMRVSRD